MASLGYAAVILAAAFGVLGAMNLLRERRLGESRSFHGWSFVALGIGCGVGAAQLFQIYGLQ